MSKLRTWTVDPEEPVFGVQPRVYSDDGKLICEVGNAEDYFDAIDEWQANSLLIAAAPDLLAVLKELCDCLGPRWFLEKNWCAPLDAISKAEPARQSATTVPQGGKSE